MHCFNCYMREREEMYIYKYIYIYTYTQINRQMCGIRIISKEMKLRCCILSNLHEVHLQQRSLTVKEKKRNRGKYEY